MRILSAFIVPLLIIALLEYYVFHQLVSDHFLGEIPVYIYLSIAVFGYLGIGLGLKFLSVPPLNRSRITNFLVGFGFASIIQKLTFVFVYVALVIVNFTVEMVTEKTTWFSTIDSRIGLLVSFIPFLAMVYGVIWGKYRFKVEGVNVRFSDLPAAFDNFKIIQISDAHSGTWDSVKGVEKGIRLIEAQKADMIVFTGDLVNGNKDEINPFMHLFKRLDPPFGKYAILGNHDYYGQPRERELRPAYYEQYFDKFKEMGFDLILNDSRSIQKKGQSIRIIGVENWGSGRYFPKRGDLTLATKDVSEDEFSILLSHDPSHWDLKALNFPHHFHLTLSGHTHGMQFGINLPFLKWSPVQYRYKRWMGLYKKDDQYLYVNRGFGVLAYPGRVGMSPEITVITLNRKS